MVSSSALLSSVAKQPCVQVSEEKVGEFAGAAAWTRREAPLMVVRSEAWLQVLQTGFIARGAVRPASNPRRLGQLATKGLDRVHRDPIRSIIRTSSQARERVGGAAVRAGLSRS